jgi:hypothetical protein
MHSKLRCLTLTALTLTLSLAAQDKEPAAKKVDFKKEIWPILEKSCIECHRAPYVDDDGKRRRPKGRVELDSLAGIKKSKKGRVVVAKDTKKSMLIQSITLPADDEDRMPPPKKGGPLPKEQIELLTRWIDEGADFGDWKSQKDEQEKAKNEPKSSDGNKSEGKGSGR